MSLNIVDKRKVTRDRTAENRQRFLRRIKSTIKDQLPDLIKGRKLSDIDAKGGKIVVRGKTVREPSMHHGQGGNVDRVMPGNTDYVPGDLLSKPPGGGRGRGGRTASDSGEGEDPFIVELTREEFLQSFFEGLELPDMVKMELSKVKEIRRENAGYQSEGSPSKLAVIRSYKNSFARRLAIRSGIDEEIAQLQAQVTELCGDTAEQRLACKQQIDDLYAQIQVLQDRKDNLPLFEDVDLTYRATVTHEDPSTHATMILIMDNSGSMGLKEKTIARKFFWLLYKFLQLNYDQIDLRFISHTTHAREMNEDEFFDTRETGGTIVSTALEETVAIMNGKGYDWKGASREALIGKTNIYVAQVSDGDNMDTDNGTCTEILEDEILPHVRSYSYIQVDDYHAGTDTISGLLSYEKGLWKSMTSVSSSNQKLQARRVFEESDIFPVFHALFKKKV